MAQTNLMIKVMMMDIFCVNGVKTMIDPRFCCVCSSQLTRLSSTPALWAPGIAAEHCSGDLRPDIS